VARIKRGITAGAALLFVAAGAFACPGGDSGGSGGAGNGGTDAVGAAPPITISWNLPDSMGLPVADSTAASLPAAAAYAWSEFIALNWPAVAQNGALNTRDMPDTTAVFGAAGAGPLVWHTFRSKVEIFPPAGTQPHGYSANAAQSYGYDALPQYTYSIPISPYVAAQTGASVPWINLDENDEIGQDAMYAGVASGQRFPADLILFLAKANRSEYNYVAANQFFTSSIAQPAFAASTSYVIANQAGPPAGNAQMASLPNGTIEIKSAWRRLTSTEATSGRFYTTTVRYYRRTSGGTAPDTIAFQDDTLGMVALHIIRKTPNQPAFIFATFEQADNLLDSLGNRVEDVDGNVNPQYRGVAPMDSAIVSRNAQQPAPAYTTANIQSFSPDSSASVPGSRVYLRNTPRFATTQGVVSVNRRIHSIPPEVVQANSNAHAAIAQYNASHGITSSPWQFYKLINVQYRPIDKPQAGVSYNGADSATYYQSNSVVETNLNLQVFSGRFQPGFDSAGTKIFPAGIITDWCGQTNTTGAPVYPPSCTAPGPFRNVRVGGHSFNMGGCMGCHGNAQLAGSDFSFILGEVNTSLPQLADPITAPNDSDKFFRIFRGTGPATAAPAARTAGTRR